MYLLPLSRKWLTPPASPPTAATTGKSSSTQTYDDTSAAIKAQLENDDGLLPPSLSSSCYASATTTNTGVNKVNVGRDATVGVYLSFMKTDVDWDSETEPECDGPLRPRGVDMPPRR